MKRAGLGRLKTLALTLMLPGLAGMIVATMASGYYLDTLPRWPAPEASRVVPRSIRGITIYQTAAEDRRLDLIEFSSMGVFLPGLVLGLVYLKKWGARQPGNEDDLTRNYR